MYIFFNCFDKNLRFQQSSGIYLKRTSGFSIKEVETIAYCLLVEPEDANDLKSVFPYFKDEQKFNKFVDDFQEALFQFDSGPLDTYFRDVLSITHDSLFEPIRRRRREEVADREAAIAAVDAAIRAQNRVDNDGNTSANE
jgi:hypothetical protein